MNIGMVQGDITKLEVDAIVNAANCSLVGGEGVDGAIHDAAGPELLEATQEIGWCETGDAVVTPGFRLPAKYVIHACGPVWCGGRRGEPRLLRRCYRKCLELANGRGCESVAFPCISAGIFRFPKRYACRIAVGTVSQWLTENASEMRVVFCTFEDEDARLYDEELERLAANS